MEPLVLTLPWPPSVNQYWRHVPSGRRVVVKISAEGRAYRTAVLARVIRLRPLPVLSGRLAVTIEAHPPDNRIHDLDNLPKAILDALTKAQVWEDDSQIDDLRIVRREVLPRLGRVVVRIQDLDGAR